MKNYQLLGILFPVAALTVASAADASIYQQDQLAALIQKTRATQAQGQTPVVVFDVDDTLTDSTSRTVVILRDWASQNASEATYGEDAIRLRSIGQGDIRYNLTDTLSQYGISSPKLASELTSAWASRFFGSSDCAIDHAITGAAEYVRALHAAGASIVYLTGRPRPSMGDCTMRSFEHLGLPLDGATTLMMKPSSAQGDLDFKKAAFAQIATFGTVIGAFENEPANVNAYGDAFAGALLFFVDSIHSSSPIRPRPDVIWLHDFLPADTRSLTDWMVQSR